MDILLALPDFKMWNLSRTSQDPVRRGVVVASLGQTAPHLVDQGPKPLLYQTAPFYLPKNPVPPNDISNSERSVTLDQMCRSGEQDLTHNIESRGSQTPSSPSTRTV